MFQPHPVFWMPIPRNVPASSSVLTWWSMLLPMNWVQLLGRLPASSVPWPSAANTYGKLWPHCKMKKTPVSLSLSPVLLGWHYSNCDGMIWHPVITTLHVYLSWKTDKLLWLPIRKRIKYKVTCMCFSVINGSGPAYLSELLHVYTPSRTLRSFSDTRMLKI